MIWAQRLAGGEERSEETGAGGLLMLGMTEPDAFVLTGKPVKSVNATKL